MKGIWIASLLATVLWSGGVLADPSANGGPGGPTSSGVGGPSGRPGGPRGMNGGGPGMFNRGGHSMGMHPCMKLHRATMEACIAAKYTRNGHADHKGLFEDCIRPTMEKGIPPVDVKVDAGLIKECQAKRGGPPKK